MRLELEADVEVLVLLVADQQAVELGGGGGLADDRAVLDDPVAVADLVPAVERLAVEQGRPARFLLGLVGGRQRTDHEAAQQGQGETKCQDLRRLHEKLLAEKGDSGVGNRVRTRRVHET